MTLGMVVAVVLLVAPIGLAVGSVAGYLGGIGGPRADARDRRIPGISAAGSRAGFRRSIEAGITSAIIAIALTAWPPYARLARADTLTVRRQRLHRRGAH